MDLGGRLGGVTLALKKTNMLMSCVIRKGLSNSTSSSWNADASELTSSWPSKCSKVKLTLTRLTSSSDHSEPGYEGTPIDYCKDKAVFDEGAVWVVE